ncbi:Holliday junction branch migration protein RuvA [Patescibacteria group bacterium]
MIAHLEGVILFRAQRFIILNVNGVGFKVFVSQDTLKKAPEKGQSIKLFTHLYVREDAMELYGFMTMAELEFFALLIAIPGIGPKSALGIFGIASLDNLKRAIASGETKYLTKVSGIGRKTAEKIVLELRERMESKDGGSSSFLEAESDAIDALMSLGYTAQESRDALKKVPDTVKNTSERITKALKALGKK